MCNREWQFSFENITSLFLIKPDLDGVSARVGKRTSQASNCRHCLIVVLEEGIGYQFREENGFVILVVDHTDVSGICAGPVTRKNQKNPKSKRNERKGPRRDPLTNSSQMVYTGLGFAFANSITNRHEPYAGCQHCRSHDKPPPFPKHQRHFTVTNTCSANKGSVGHAFLSDGRVVTDQGEPNETD
jgi:hypothetical protein